MEYDLQRMFTNLVLDEDTPFDIKEALSNAMGGFIFGSVVKGTESVGDWAARKMGLIQSPGPSWVQSEGSETIVSSDGDIVPQNKGPRMVEYGDQETKSRIMAEVGGRMVQEGKIVQITDGDLAALGEYYPDLRGVKRTDQPQIKKENQKAVRTYIKSLLHQTFDGKDIEFSIDGDILEAQLYSEGINHVAGRLPKEKTAMLEKSEELFSKAEYLYSTGNDVHSKASDSNRITRWDYFYTPIEIGGELQGVRIAVKHVETGTKAQIYDWGIKQQETDFRPKGGKSNSPAPTIGTSSQFPIDTSSIAQSKGTVNAAGMENSGVDLLNVKPLNVDASPFILANEDFKQREERKKTQIKADIEQAFLEGNRKKGGPPRIFPENMVKAEPADTTWVFLENTTGKKSKKRQQLEEKRKADLEAIQARNEQLKTQKLYGDAPKDTENPMTMKDWNEVQEVLNNPELTDAEDGGRTQKHQTAQTAFERKLKEIFPGSRSKDDQKAISEALGRIAAEYEDRGTISKETADQVFEQVYDATRVVNDDFYNQFKGLKDEIRQTKFFLSDADRANISDFEAFRKANTGNFTVTRKGDGVPVDTKYQELAAEYPQFFPADITDPAAQLQQISEVSGSISKVVESLDEHYGGEAEEAKAYARERFQEALDGYAEDLQVIDHKAPAAMSHAELDAYEDWTDEDKGPMEALKNAGESVLGQLPFASNVMALLAVMRGVCRLLPPFLM